MASSLMWMICTKHNSAGDGLVVLRRYRGFRDENGEYLPEYFHLLAIRLAFVIIFEVSVSQISLSSEHKNRPNPN